MIRGWCGPGRWCAWLGRRMGGWPGWWPCCRWLTGRRWPRWCWARLPAWPLMRVPGWWTGWWPARPPITSAVTWPTAAGCRGVQIGLIRGLEKLGDPAAAYEVATAALAELEALPPAARDAGQRQELLMAALRLARTRPGRDQDDDPVVAEAVELALSGGAAVRTEARVWAAVDLLHRPGHRQDGLRLAHQVTAELESRHIHGDLAAQWRLLLAFHAGQAGDTALAQRLLATMMGQIAMRLRIYRYRQA